MDWRADPLGQLKRTSGANCFVIHICPLPVPWYTKKSCQNEVQKCLGDGNQVERKLSQQILEARLDPGLSPTIALGKQLRYGLKDCMETWDTNMHALSKCPEFSDLWETLLDIDRMQPNCVFGCSNGASGQPSEGIISIHSHKQPFNAELSHSVF